jgi:hypothetical protein
MMYVLAYLAGVLTVPVVWYIYTWINPYLGR